MLERVKNFMFRGQQAAIRKVSEVAEIFAKEEKGASDIVAIIVIIAIILVVAAVFREALKKAVTDVFGNLTQFINNNK